MSVTACQVQARQYFLPAAPVSRSMAALSIQLFSQGGCFFSTTAFSARLLYRHGHTFGMETTSCTIPKFASQCDGIFCAMLYNIFVFLYENDGMIRIQMTMRSGISELPVRSDLQHTPGQNYFPIRDEINFRDLGGYRSSDGRMTRQGCFYRSGGLYKMNDSELAFLKSLHIRTLLDLRTKAEAAKKPDPVLPGVTVLQHSGVVSAGGEEIDFSPAGMKLLGEAGLTQIENMHQYYRMMPFHNEALHILMKEVICGNVPVLFHCATGKDRTGVAAMILLLLLGVPEQTVLQDYLLSNFYRRDVIRRHMEEDQTVIRRHPEREALLQLQHGVSPKIGREILENIRMTCGGYEEYFEQEYGLGQAEIEKLRNRYLV